MRGDLVGEITAACVALLSAVAFGAQSRICAFHWTWSSVLCGIIVLAGSRFPDAGTLFLHRCGRFVSCILVQPHPQGKETSWPGTVSSWMPGRDRNTCRKGLPGLWLRFVRWSCNLSSCFHLEQLDKKEKDRHNQWCRLTSRPQRSPKYLKA